MVWLSPVKTAGASAARRCSPVVPLAGRGLSCLYKMSMTDRLRGRTRRRRWAWSVVEAKQKLSEVLEEGGQGAADDRESVATRGRGRGGRHVR